MREMLCAQVIAVIRRIFAAVIGEIVPAIVAPPAGYIGPDDHAVSGAQRNAFEIRVFPVSTDRRDGAHIFVSLNDGELQLSVAVLRGVALKGVLVGSADPGHFHLDEHTTRRGLWKRVFPYLVLPGFDKRCRKHALCRHRGMLFVILALRWVQPAPL